MAKFLIRRFLFMLFTLFFVSVVVFAITELAPGDVVRHMLGQFATPEQEDSLREQLGLNRPVWVRYLSWLVGSDLLWAQPKVDMPLTQTVSKTTGFAEWWAVEPDDSLIRWKLEGNDLIALRRQPDGTSQQSVDNKRWNIDAEEEAARLRDHREQVLMDQQLLQEDKELLVAQIDRLVGILEQDGVSDEEILPQIEGPESALDALIGDQMVQELRALRIAANGIRQNDVVEALDLARTLSASGAKPSEELLKTAPNMLGKAATLLSEANPELSENLREASRSILARDLDAAGATLGETVAPMEELTKPLTDVAEAVESGNYAWAADLLETMFDPSDPADPAFVALMIDQSKASARALRDILPDVAEAFEATASALAEGDLAAADAGLENVAGYFRDRGPHIAAHAAARSAKVGRWFWGVDNLNHAVKWETGGSQVFWMRAKGAGWWVEQEGGASEYIPLQRGLLRGDPGESVRTRQPVSAELIRRVRNSLILAGLAFVVVMPLALLMGLVAGLNEGKTIDRVFSIFGLVTTASPNFATGVFLILIFSVWLDILPGATVFTSSDAIFEKPEMLILPVLTLTLIELGYVLRITRASMVEVMKTGYIRTAFLKGLPYWRIVFKHAVRNALMAPITVIMLHVNWLMGGIVVVEAIFGYPGLGTYLLNSAFYKDVFAIEAGAMVMVLLAVGTQLVADIIYTFLNPRIRYA
jgi:peptide/nickel transport system permease protein